MSILDKMFDESFDKKLEKQIESLKFDVLYYASIFTIGLIPLGIWKLMDIIIWAYQHIHITIK
jgi:hypothetical protein